MDTDPKTLSDYTAMIARRKLGVCVIFTVVSLGAIVASSLMPRLYRSTAMLLMEAPVQKTMVQSATTPAPVDFVDEQVKSVTQRAMTTANILAIVRAHDLYDFSKKSRQQYEIAKTFKEDAEVELVRSKLVEHQTSGRTDVAFTISFSYNDPKKAQQVASDLAQLFIEENDKARAERTGRTTDFLSDEASKLGLRINDIDEKISAYKNSYRYSLPEYMQGNLTSLDLKRGELQTVEQQLVGAADKVAFLASELTRLPSAPDRLVAPAGQAGGEGGSMSLRERYLQARSKYSADHPDVIRLRRQMEAEGEDLSGSGSDDLPAATPGQPAAAPVRKEAVNAVYLGVQIQYRNAQSELEALQQRKRALDAEIYSLQQRVALTPGVEKDYTSLLRERDLAVTKYQQLNEKLVDARLMKTLEKEQQGQTLTVIEQPLVPVWAEKSSRRKVFVGGLVAATVLALSYAFFAEMLDTRVRGPRGIQELTGLIPLVSIPNFDLPTEAERKRMRRRRHRKLIVWAAVVLLAGIAVLLATLLFGRPAVPGMGG